MSPRDLPVWQLHFEILRTLRDGTGLVLVAATGSGKTTQVPQMIENFMFAGSFASLARSIVMRVALDWETPFSIAHA